MNYSLIYILFGISFLTTYSLIPVIRNLAIKINIVDKPDFRKIHKKEIVRLASISIFIGFIFSISSIIPISRIYELNLNNIFTNNNLLLILFGFLFFLLGLIDDLFNISPFIRLFVQSIIIYFLWINGIAINNIDFSWINSDLNWALDSVLSFIITFLWISGVANAINWIDGLDGLAGSISIAVFLGLLAVNINLGNLFFIINISALLGSSFAFLKFNINPAQILMGDGGSYFLGFYLASLTLLTFSDYEFGTNIFLAFLILLLPISDMFFIILKRLKNKQSIFKPDKSHIHHRLLNIGFSSNQTLLVIFSINQFFVFLTLYFSLSFISSYLMIFSTVWLFISLFYILFKKNNNQI